MYYFLSKTVVTMYYVSQLQGERSIIIFHGHICIETRNNVLM